jgi:hypothetical protein
MTINPSLERAAMGFVLLTFWTGIITWLRLGRSPAIIALVLLLALLIYPLYALIKPAGQTDPALRAAQAGLFAIVLFLLLMIVLLVLGMKLHRQGLVWTAFVASMIPVLAVSCGMVVYLVGLCLKKQ